MSYRFSLLIGLLACNPTLDMGSSDENDSCTPAGFFCVDVSLADTRCPNDGPPLDEFSCGADRADARCCAQGLTEIISGFSPASEQTVGRTLTVFGSFAFPTATNDVSIDGIAIPASAFLAGSNGGQILFVIPTGIDVSNGGKNVIVRVRNDHGADQRGYTLTPYAPGLPDPVIEQVVDGATDAPTLRTGHLARVTGFDLVGSGAGTSGIVLVLNPGVAQRVFPAAGSLIVDWSASVIAAAPLASTLLVFTPLLIDADGVAVGDSAPAMVVLTVPGANNPARVGVSIERVEPTLTLSSLSPNPVQVGAPLTISGIGLADASPEAYRVWFDSLQVVAANQSGSDIVVDVPAGIPGLVTPGDSVGLQVWVLRTTDGAVAGPLGLTVDL